MTTHAEPTPIAYGYWVKGRVGSRREKEWVYLSSTAPIFLRRAEAVSEVVARVTQKTPFGTEHVFEYRVVDGVLMRNQRDEYRVALDLPHPDFDGRAHPDGAEKGHEWRYRTPKDRESRHLIKAIEVDHEEPARKAMMERARCMRVVAGDVYAPALPPSWAFSFDNLSLKLKASVPDSDVPNLAQPGFPLLSMWKDSATNVPADIPFCFVGVGVPHEPIVNAWRALCPDQRLIRAESEDAIEVFDADALASVSLSESSARAAFTVLDAILNEAPWWSLTPPLRLAAAKGAEVAWRFRKGELGPGDAVAEVQEACVEVLAEAVCPTTHPIPPGEGSSYTRETRLFAEFVVAQAVAREARLAHEVSLDIGAFGM